MYSQSVETFLSVVRSQSLSQAAKELNIAQTTVSQRLKVLEQELGLTLLERSKGVKNIHLTPAGEEFCKLAEQWSIILQEVKVLQAHGPQYSLTIGSVDSLNNFTLPPIYRSLSRHTPPIKLHIRTSHSIDLYTEVENRKVDVAFVLRELVHPNVIVKKCFSSSMVVLRLSNNTEQKSSTVDPSDLDSSHELFMPWGANFQSWHEKWWNPPSPLQIKLDSANLLLSLLQDPNRWAIVPMWIATAAFKQGNYHMYQLTDPPPHYTCYRLTHKNSSTALLHCLNILNQYFQLHLPELMKYQKL